METTREPLQLDKRSERHWTHLKSYWNNFPWRTFWVWMVMVGFWYY